MRLSAPLLALVLLLTACAAGGKDDAGPTEPKVVVPEAGQCVAGEVADGDDVAPDFTTVVPCTEPHAYEVIDVRPVPGRFLDTASAKASLARRTELARVDDDAPRRARRLHAVMWPGCDQALRVATGVDRFTFEDKDAKRLRVNPHGHGMGPWLNLAPAEVWGEHQVAVCSVRYAGSPTEQAPHGPVRPVTSADAKQVISTWMTPAFPEEFRVCQHIGRNRRVPCSEQHGMEYLWTTDFKAAFGRDFLAGYGDLAALPREEYDATLTLCRRLYLQTGNRAEKGMRVNYRFNPETDDPDGRTLQMSCVLQTNDEKDRLTGFTSLR